MRSRKNEYSPLHAAIEAAQRFWAGILCNTRLYVTHDQIEAMTLATIIAVLKAGELQQVGTPDEIYNFPANTFVADFMGSPAMNRISGKLEKIFDELVFVFGHHSLTLTEPSDALQARLETASKVDFGIRAENICEANSYDASELGRPNILSLTSRTGRADRL